MVIYVFKLLRLFLVCWRLICIRECFNMLIWIFILCSFDLSFCIVDLIWRSGVRLEILLFLFIIFCFICFRDLRSFVCLIVNFDNVFLFWFCFCWIFDSWFCIVMYFNINDFNCWLMKFLWVFSFFSDEVIFFLNLFKFVLLWVKFEEVFL